MQPWFLTILVAVAAADEGFQRLANISLAKAERSIPFCRSRHRFITMKIYYDVGCPATKKFFAEQLEPAWRELGGFVYYDLNPYGQTKRIVNDDGKWDFKCPRGLDECRAALGHACLKFDQLLTYQESTEFRMCLMKQRNPHNLKECERELDLESVAERITECIDTDSSNLVFQGDLTDKFQKPLKYSPTISIEQTHIESLQYEALTDLKGLLCKILDYVPEACEPMAPTIIPIETSHTATARPNKVTTHKEGNTVDPRLFHTAAPPVHSHWWCRRHKTY